MEWIKQDSAKGQCPMCRQSMLKFPKQTTLLLMYYTEFEWGEAEVPRQSVEEQQDTIVEDQ